MRVHIAAADTFRAAAIDQLKIWGERAGAPVFARASGADAAGLAFDALKESARRQCRCAAHRHRRAFYRTRPA
jgi:fused signal recognition particle receptor